MQTRYQDYIAEAAESQAENDIRRIAEGHEKKAVPRMIVANMMKLIGRDCRASGDDEMRMYWDARAGRMEDCGSYIVLGKYADGHAAQMDATYCRDRLCPTCGWRRALKAAAELQQCMNYVAANGETYRWLFLTLTVTNVSGDKLPGAIDEMLESWRMFQMKTRFRAAVKGWMRSLEVTYNPVRKDYHPHVHALLMVLPGYFHGKNYVQQEEWRRMWKEAARLSYEPQVDIRAVREDEESAQKSVREIAKYSLKSNMIKATMRRDGGDVETPKKMVGVFDAALAGRRLYAYGGRLRAVRRELRYRDDEKDLGRDIRPDTPVSVMALHYMTDSGKYVAGGEVSYQDWLEDSRAERAWLKRASKQQMAAEAIALVEWEEDPVLSHMMGEPMMVHTDFREPMPLADLLDYCYGQRKPVSQAEKDARAEQRRKRKELSMREIAELTAGGGLS